MILADTSAWVEYDRRTESSVDRRLDELIRSDAALAVTEPVIAEVASGARTDERERQLRNLLDRFEPLHFDAAADFDGAVAIYRQCRARGVTPRGLLDCMIANVALRYDVPLLAHDSDIARIATVLPLGLDEASLRSV